MLVFSRSAGAVALLVILVLCSACKKQSTITINGSVVRNGQPISLGPNGDLMVTLHPDLPPDAPFTPKVTYCDKATGKFEFRDIPPGKYKVGIQQFDPDPTSDKLNGAFRAETGKIVRELDGKEPLVLDLANPG